MQVGSLGNLCTIDIALQMGGIDGLDFFERAPSHQDAVLRFVASDIAVHDEQFLRACPGQFNVPFT